MSSFHRPILNLVRGPLALTAALFSIIATGSAQTPALESIQMLGGSGYDSVLSAVSDNAGNLYLLGSTQSPDFPSTKLYGKRAAAGVSLGDLFVAKIRLADWSLVYSTIIGSAKPLGLAVDSVGNAYVAGSTALPDQFPATPGAFRTQLTGYPQATFAIKLNRDTGGLVYSTLLTAGSTAAIAVDAMGQAYVTGIAAPATVPVTKGAYLTQTDTRDLAFVLKLRSDAGGIVFASFLAKGAPPTPTAIAVDKDENVYVAGFSDDYVTAFPATPGAVQTESAGAPDAFVMKLAAAGDSLIYATLLGGAGGDSATFLSAGDDGSAYVAGYCDSGSPANPSKPFPTTSDAPYRKFQTFSGFFARLNASGTKLLFSTHLTDQPQTPYSSAPLAMAVAPGAFYFAYPSALTSGFFGPAVLDSFMVQATGIVGSMRTARSMGRPGFSPMFRPPDLLSVAGNSWSSATEVPSTARFPTL